MPLHPYYEEPGITIYHGDCLEVLPQFESQAFSLIVTDPPYGVGFKYGSDFIDINEDYSSWICSILGEMIRVSRIVILTPGISNLWIYPPATWVLCWEKPGSPRRSRLGGFNTWEPILIYGKRRIYNDSIRLPAWNNTARDAENHPCPKPLSLYMWLVHEGSDVGMILLDPFMGSGTSLIAAKNLGRRAIGIEIEERYCEIAVNRLRQGVLGFVEVP